MDGQRYFWGIIAYLGMLLPTVGMIIGLIRYRKYGEDVKRKVDEDYKRAQEKGGIHSLYYKRRDRVFKKTFGTPILVTFLIGLVLLFLAMHNL